MLGDPREDLRWRRAAFEDQLRAKLDDLKQPVQSPADPEILLYDGAAMRAYEQTPHHYARLFAQSRSRGRPVPTNDLWIAALAVQHDLILCSRDAHFSNFPQLVRV